MHIKLVQSSLIDADVSDSWFTWNQLLLASELSFHIRSEGYLSKILAQQLWVWISPDVCNFLCGATAASDTSLALRLMKLHVCTFSTVEHGDISNRIQHQNIKAVDFSLRRVCLIITGSSVQFEMANNLWIMQFCGGVVCNRKLVIWIQVIKRNREFLLLVYLVESQGKLL